MLGCVLGLSMLIALGMAIILVKVERIERKYTKTIKIYRPYSQVKSTIEELEKLGWVYVSQRPLNNEFTFFEITFVK